jgi:hypothetical protein
MDKPTQCIGSLPSLSLPLTVILYRRFKDFVTLNSDVCENFRGHQLFSRFVVFFSAATVTPNPFL